MPVGHAEVNSSTAQAERETFRVLARHIGGPDGGGRGAFEVAARLSYMDLDDKECGAGASPM